MVIPSPKNNKVQHFNDLSPISILSCLSKLLEKNYEQTNSSMYILKRINFYLVTNQDLDKVIVVVPQFLTLRMIFLEQLMMEEVQQ